MSEEAAASVRSRLDDSLSLVEQTTERIRNLMADLRPPVLDDYGLVAALHWYGGQFTDRTGTAVSVEGGIIAETHPVGYSGTSPLKIYTATVEMLFPTESLVSYCDHGCLTDLND